MAAIALAIARVLKQVGASPGRTSSQKRRRSKRIRPVTYRDCDLTVNRC